MARNRFPAPEIRTYSDHQVITPPNLLRSALQWVTETDIDDPVARAEKALAGLSGEFKKWMLVETERLSAAYAAILEGGFTDAAREELFRAAHDIRGHAATFGYPFAGATAESLCRLIEHAPELERVPDHLIKHHVEAILAIAHERTMLETQRTASELTRELRGLADEFLVRANRDRPEHLDAILVSSIVPG